MSWTDERVALLRKMWGEGKTAAEIASTLGNVTRNAVIGKAHRLKLSNRISPIQQNNKKPSAPARAANAATPKGSSRKIVIREEDIQVKRIPLVELTPRQCRWPLGDPKDAEFTFCGSNIVPGLPYCPGHAKMAYQTASRNRILKPDDVEHGYGHAEGDEDAKEAVA
jgi:GcrA cell cycle regulator